MLLYKYKLRKDTFLCLGKIKKNCFITGRSTKKTQRFILGRTVLLILRPIITTSGVFVFIPRWLDALAVVSGRHTPSSVRRSRCLTAGGADRNGPGVADESSFDRFTKWSRLMFLSAIEAQSSRPCKIWVERDITRICGYEWERINYGTLIKTRKHQKTDVIHSHAQPE